MDAKQPFLELQVIRRIKGAFRSREAWEAEYPDLAPLDDEWVMLQNWASMVHELGVTLAQLAVFPKTRAELLCEMPGSMNRSPAWLEAHFEGQRVMTLELFLHGIAQTLARQREGFERVVVEQVSDPGAIEDVLAEAPVPTGTEERSELFRAVGNVAMAHMEALVELAYDLEVKSGLHPG